MTHVSRRLAIFTTGVLLAMVMTILTAGSAAAGSSLSFSTFIGDPCVFIDGAAPNAEIKFVIRDGFGTLLVRETLTADSSGSALFCAGFGVAAGHKLKAVTSSGEHVLVVPQVSIRLNRVTDRLRGTGPTGATLRIRCERADPFRHFEPCIWRTGVTVGGDGEWATSVPFDFIGGAEFFVLWRSGDDRVGAWGTAPFISATLDRPWFSGATRANAVKHIELEGKASTTVVGDPFDGTFRDRFRDASDNPVNLAPGDSLMTDISVDAHWIAPDIDASVGVNSDVVSGRCYDTGSSARLVQVLLHRSGKERGWALLDTEADGTFSFDFQTDGDPFWTNADVRDGDRITVRCMQVEGDWVQRVLFASA